MSSEWTLPLIQAELDGLPLGCDFILAQDDTARLFGRSSAATRRITSFAAAHGCRAGFRGNELVFRKRLPPAVQDAVVDPAAVECFPPICPPPSPSGDDHPGAGCR